MAALARDKRNKKQSEPKRVAILDPARCMPPSEAYDYLKKASRACRMDCIYVKGKKVKKVLSKLRPANSSM